MLEGLVGFVYEYILQYLCPRDYVQLCTTSSTLYHYTSAYLTHCCDAANRNQNMKRFFAANYKLLLPYERKLYNAYVHVLKTVPGVDYRRLPLYQELLNVIVNSDDVTRISITTSQVFGYLGDRDHVYLQHSQELQRDVVYLKEISWLIFCTNLPKFYSNVYPATYQIRLHLQIRDDVIWKGDQPMVIRLQRCASNEIVRRIFIHPSVWSELAAGKEANLDYNGYNDIRNLRILPTQTPSWFFLVIDNVTVAEGDELYFTVDDRTNVFWKSGKSWDFLEVIRLS